MRSILALGLLSGRQYEQYMQKLVERYDQLSLAPEETISLKQLGELPIRLRMLESHDEAALQPADAISSDDARGESLQVWDIPGRSSRVLVFGTRGSGKAMMLRYMAVTIAADAMPAEQMQAAPFRRPSAAPPRFMPFYIHLPDLAAQAGSLPQFLEAQCTALGFARSGRFLRQRLEAGECFLLLNGLDRVPENKREWVVEQINALSMQYPALNQFIVTCEPDGYPGGLEGFSSLELMGTSEEGISTFISQRFSSSPAKARALLGMLEWTPRLRSLATSPLYLMAITRALSSAWQSAPVRVHELVGGSIVLLLEAAQERTANNTQSTLSSDDLLIPLQEIAYEFHRARRATMTPQEIAALPVESSDAKARDLSPYQDLLHDAGLWLSWGSNGQGFGHLAFQEYLAAKEILRRGEAGTALAHVQDPWWQETIVYLAGLTNDPDFIRRVGDQKANPSEGALLAARCLSEARLDEFPKVEVAMRRELIEVIAEFFSKERADWKRAALALASIEHKSVSHAYTDLLRDEEAVMRACAALGMGRVGDEAWATGPLVEALSDSEPQVRANAAQALGRLGSIGAIPVLLEELGDVPAVAAMAAQALGQIGQPAVRPCIRALRASGDRGREMAARALTFIGKPAVAPLLDLAFNRQRDGDARRRAMLALGEIGDQEAIAPLIEMLYEPEGELSLAAAKGLSRIGSAAVDPLLAALAQRTRRSIDATEQIIRALVGIGNAAVQGLLNALDDPEPEIRDAAERALVGIGPSAATPAMEALGTSSHAVQRRLARVLGQVGDENSMQALIELLPVSEPSVQIRLVQALGQIGNKDALSPLLSLMQREDLTDTLRREAIRALGNLGDPDAAESLASALAEAQYRDTAATALSQIGEPAVPHLVRAFYDVSDEKSRRLVIDALGRIGRVITFDERSFAEVAHTLHYLITEHGNYGTDQLIDRLHSLVWWPEGEEIYRAFRTASELMGIESLEQAPQYGNLLDWVRQERTWLRPPLRDILVGFGDVAENIKVFLAVRHRSGGEALLSSVDKINGMQSIIDAKLVDFERLVFGQVVSHWRTLLDNAIKEMRGRAELEINTLNKQILLPAPTGIAPIVFDLRNMGDSVARNLSATLTVGRFVGASIVDSSLQRLAPLGSGSHQEVEFSIQRQGADEATLTLEVIYDDDEAQGHKAVHTTTIQFGLIGKYKPIPASPYVPGMPIKSTEMFFGRTDTLNWIARNLGGAYQQNMLVLHGERRIGKTSILFHLQSNPPTPRHICIFFSFELSVPTSVSKFLYDMTYSICRGLRRYDIEVPRPPRSEFDNYAEERFRLFCDQLTEYLGDKVVVLMMDEFGILIQKVHDGEMPKDILHFLRGISQDQEALTFIFVGAYLLRTMLRDEQSILFNIAQVRKIENLKPDEAEELIRKPVAGYIEYDALVVNRIKEVTACHPYFVQCICDEMVKLAQEGQKNYLNLSDLELALQKVTEDATGQINNSIYMHLTEPEKRTLAALAELTTAQAVYLTPDQIAQALERHELSIPRADLLEALKQLCERDLVVEERVGQRLAYGFEMGLIRRWLRAKEMLIRLREAENL